MPISNGASMFAAALMLSLSVAAFQPAHAAVSNYGQAAETGAYASRGGNKTTSIPLGQID